MSSVTSLRAPGSGPQHIAVGTAETDRQLTDSTRLMYSADMAAFTAWCASVDRRPLPATPETVTEYVAHLTVTPSPSDEGDGRGGVLLAGHDVGLYADA